MAVAICSVSARADGGDSVSTARNDSASVAPWGVDVRPGLLDGKPNLSNEIRHGLGRSFTIDAICVTGRPAILLGASYYPGSVLYLQGSAGIPIFGAETDFSGPIFHPDYVYGFRGGARLTFGGWFTASLGAGLQFGVDLDYCSNCNGVFLGGGQGEEPVLVTKFDSCQIWEAGIGIVW